MKVNIKFPPILVSHYASYRVVREEGKKERKKERKKTGIGSMAAGLITSLGYE